MRPHVHVRAKYLLQVSGVRIISGRDIIAPGTPLLPKDAEAFKYMGGKDVMWRIWGLLWYAFSTMKIYAVYTGAAENDVSTAQIPPLRPCLVERA